MSSSDKSKFTFRAIEVFIAIVEEGGITSAAKRLGASPSAVSLQLSNLETSLDARLIDRSSRHFSLTSAGELFHPRALRILDEATSASAALAQTTASPRLTIKLAIIEDFDSLVLPHWLRTINEGSANIRFHVKSGPSHENHAALANRSADIIVAVDTSDPTDWVEEHPILSDPYIIVKSASLSKIGSMDRLMKHPFIRYSREQFMGRQIEAHLRRNKIVPAREHEFSSNQAVLSMVRQTGGWTITTVAALSSVTNFQGIQHGAMGLTISPLPIPAFRRTVSLYARRDALGTLPNTFANSLRAVLNETFINPLGEAFPELIGAVGIHTFDNV